MISDTSSSEIHVGVSGTGMLKKTLHECENSFTIEVQKICKKVLRESTLPRKRKKRKIVAVGDLHGDFYRLVRILREHGILEKQSLNWSPRAASIDLVLLGDYVDWRGEPLEGPPDEWPLGIKRLLDLIISLWKDLELLKSRDGFAARFCPLLGNHDEMMLESFRILKGFYPLKSKILFKKFRKLQPLLKFFGKLTTDPMKTQEIFKVINWYEQGGEMTMESFGGLHIWMEAMEGEHGAFLSRELQHGVVINRKLFIHTAPDDREFWMPIEELEKLPTLTWEKAREQILWGRKLWGYNAFTGGPTLPFSQEEVEEMLKKMGVEALVVGHTPFFREGPLLAYGGRVINIDTHGVSGSAPFVEEYEPDGWTDSSTPPSQSEPSSSEKELKREEDSGNKPEDPQEY